MELLVIYMVSASIRTSQIWKNGNKDIGMLQCWRIIAGLFFEMRWIQKKAKKSRRNATDV